MTRHWAVWRGGPHDGETWPLDDEKGCRAGEKMFPRDKARLTGFERVPYVNTGETVPMRDGSIGHVFTPES